MFNDDLQSEAEMMKWKKKVSLGIIYMCIDWWGDWRMVHKGRHGWAQKIHIPTQKRVFYLETRSKFIII